MRCFICDIASRDSRAFRGKGTTDKGVYQRRNVSTGLSITLRYQDMMFELLTFTLGCYIRQHDSRTMGAYDSIQS